MASLKSLVVRIGADDKDVVASLRNLGDKSQELAKSLSQVGGKPLGETALKSLNDLINKQQQAAATALKTAAGLDQIGGASRLTSSQLAVMNRTIQEGIQAYSALGQKAPAEVLRVADAIEKRLKPAMNDIEPTALTAKMVAFGSAVGSFVGNLAYDAVKKLGGALIDIAGRGITLAPITDSFQRLARTVGESGDAMLSVSRTATKGLINDLDLMQAANKAILLGLPVTSQEFGTLAQTAVVLGKAMGQGATQSLNDLTTALGRSSPLILDNLGLTVKVGEANEQYARSVGKSADELSDAEKKLAFYNAAMQAAKARVEDLGGLNLTLADRVQQVQVAFGNFTDALGVAIAKSPVINAAFGGVGDAISTAFGENQTTLVLKLIGVVNKMGVATATAAQLAVSAAGYISQGWSALQLVFSGTASIISLVGLAFAKLVAGAAEIATKIPALGSAFKGLAASTRDLEQFMGGVQQSFHDQAQEALEGVKGNSAFQRTLDGVSGKLSDLKAKMIAASNTQASATGIAAALAKKFDAVGESASGSAEQIKKNTQSLTVLKDTIRTLESSGGIVGALGGTIGLTKPAEALREIIASLTAIQRIELSAGIVSPLGGAIALVKPQIGDLGEAFRKLAKDAQKEIGAASSSVGGLLSVIQSIPGTIASAFTGGGGLIGGLQSIGSQLGATLGQSIGKGVATLGSLGGPIGSALGSLIGPVIGKIASLFSSAEKQVNPVRQAFVDAAGGLEQLNRRAAAAGVTLNAMLNAKNPEAYKKAIEDLNAAFQFQDSAMATLDETVKRYGFSLSELGPALQRSELDKKAQGLFQDFQVLTSAGIDVATVIEKMSGNINTFVQDALATGTEVPSAMKPMLEKMIEMGKLTDASGNAFGSLEDTGITFSSTMTEGFKTVVSAVDKLTQAIARGLGVALDETTQRIKAIPKDIDINVNYREGSRTGSFQDDIRTASGASTGGRVTTGGIQHFANGGRVLRFKPRGADTVPAMLKPGEMVITELQQQAIGSRLSDGGDYGLVGEVRALRLAQERQASETKAAIVTAVRDAVQKISRRTA